jgi:hypothetical protein
MVKGSFFVVNDSLTMICLPWSIDHYQIFLSRFFDDPGRFESLAIKSVSW